MEDQGFSCVRRISVEGQCEDYGHKLIEAQNPPQIQKYQKKTAFTQTFSGSSRELLPASLWDDSGTQPIFSRKACSNDVLISWVDVSGGFSSSELSVLRGRVAIFSYRAMLIVIALAKNVVLVFHGVSHSYRAICCKMGCRTDVCETTVPTGDIAPFGEVLTSLKRYCVIWGITAILSQHHTIWGN